jgi:hypothetical protein
MAPLQQCAVTDLAVVAATSLQFGCSLVAAFKCKALLCLHAAEPRKVREYR